VQIRCPSTTRKTNKTPKYIKQVSVHKRFWFTFVVSLQFL
jgi:hypothetical protein